MPSFSNGKVTTSVIFYNRGIPPNDKSFGTYALVNYEMLRNIYRYNRRIGRPVYQMF